MRPRGGIIGANITPTQTAASGIWTLREVEAYQRAGAWAALPGAPTSVSGTAGNAQVSLTWSAPAATGGYSITDYTVQYSSDSGSSWTTFSRSASASASALVTGLSNGTAYVFRVAAVTVVGTGSYSSASSSVTPASSQSLYVAGWNADGQLGTGIGISKYNLYISWTQVGTATTWKTASITSQRMIVLSNNGTLWGAGYNDTGVYGRPFGYGSTNNFNSLTQLGTGTQWASIACGGGHSLALDSAGYLYGTGSNYNQQLPAGQSNTWTLQDSTYTYKSIGAGPIQSFLIRSDGTLWSAGYNGNVGALGRGASLGAGSYALGQVGSDTDWASVVGPGNGGAGDLYGPTFAIKTNGTLWGWGWVYGSSPVQIGTSTWRTVSCGGRNIVAAIRTDGTLWVKSNGNELNGSTYDFTQAMPGSTFTAVGAGFYYALAIRSDGTLWGIGSNDVGQLGNGSTSALSNWTQIGSATNWRAVWASNRFSVALRG